MVARKQTWRAMLAALVVAAGVAVAWAVASGWVGSVVVTWLSDDDDVAEELQIASDGTPVIVAQSYGAMGGISLSRRTLDGQPWSADYESWLGGAYLVSQSKPAGLVELPLAWTSYGQRIVGGTDGKEPPTAWYAVRNAAPEGRVYWIGFDALSKRQIGYIGKQGFRPTLPQLEDQFSIPRGRDWPLNRYLASTQYLDPRSLVDYHALQKNERLAPWLAFLIDGKNLWEIDLRARATRVALDVPNAVSISSLTTPEATLGQPAPEQNASSRARPVPFRLAAAQILPQPYAVFRAAAPAEGPKLVSAIAVRTTDRIVIYDPPTGRKWEFKLPPELAAEVLSVYWPSENQMLISGNRGYWSGGPINHLLWLKPDGIVERREQTNLAGYVPEPPEKSAWAMSGMAPAPIAWLAGVFVGAPLMQVQNNQASDYADGLSRTINVAWPPLVLVLIVGAALAWLTLWLHNKYRRSAAGRWAAFVFLLGLPGFIAYWLEHRGTKLERCPECHAIVPRDREMCAACNAEFPAPPRVGTEILA